MKTILTITFVLTTCFAFAQWTGEQHNRKHFLYSTGEYIVGKNNAGSVSLNYIYNNKLSINVGYSATNKTNVPMPLDFLKSASEANLISGPAPFENTETLHIMIGKVFTLSNPNSIRLLIQGGPGLSNHREPDFYLENNEFAYQTDIKRQVSFVFNPKVEVPVISGLLGLSAGPVLVAGNNTYFGAGVGVIYGIVKH